ncbi:MAG TPA: hypothetical protein VFE47_22840 [Tepidisphaeraceae bacterium]|jgi:hypothetical protein|nr:hypothetical protein [Tepidisphaeraceae bacterium]
MWKCFPVGHAPALAVADIPPLPADTTVLVRFDLAQCTPDSLAAKVAGNGARDLDQPIAMIKPYFDALTSHHAMVVWFSASAQADHPGPVSPTFYAEVAAEADATAISNDLPKVSGLKTTWWNCRSTRKPWPRAAA